MSKIFHIILISLFSLTVISCSSSSDDDSSTTSTTDEDTTTDNTTTTSSTSNTCPAENWWQLMEGSTSRNVSLFGTPTLSRNSERTSGNDLYVDQAALSQYPKRDNYLLFDPFDADINYPFVMKGHPHGNTIWQSGNDQVDLSASAPVLSDNFTPVSYTHLTLPTICSV